MSPTAAARVEWQLVTTASRAAAHRTHDQQGAAAELLDAADGHGRRDDTSGDVRGQIGGKCRMQNVECRMKNVHSAFDILHSAFTTTA